MTPGNGVCNYDCAGEEDAAADDGAGGDAVAGDSAGGTTEQLSATEEKDDDCGAQAVETTKRATAGRLHQSAGQLPEGSTFCSTEREGRNQEI